MNYLATSNTLLIVQTIKQISQEQQQQQFQSKSKSQSKFQSLSPERQYWAMIPPPVKNKEESRGNNQEYQIESMFMIQLCDQESFLMFSNYPSFLSMRSCNQITSRQNQREWEQEEHEQKQLQYEQEVQEQELEMKEFIETSIRLLGTVEIYNPLAFPSHISQAIPNEELDLSSLKSTTDVS